jgi:hypothetical protein
MKLKQLGTCRKVLMALLAGALLPACGGGGRSAENVAHSQQALSGPGVSGASLGLTVLTNTSGANQVRDRNLGLLAKLRA